MGIDHRQAPLRAEALAALAALLCGCAGTPLRPVDGKAGLSASEVVLVGKVELVPPLDKDEQVIKGIGTASLRNTVFMLLDPRRKGLDDEPTLADYDGRLEAPLGRTFFVARKAEPFFIRAGVLYTRLDGRGQKRAYLPGGLKVDVRPGDRAVYVGTIRYERDEFFRIQRTAVVDDYDQAAAAFRKKFAGLPLRRALAAKP